MSALHLVPDDLQGLYHVKERRDAAGLLATACPLEWGEIVEVLRAFRSLCLEVPNAETAGRLPLVAPDDAEA